MALAQALLDQLQQSRLLEESQLGDAQKLARNYADGAEYVDALVRRGLLTGWQAKVLSSGQAQRLVMGSYVLVEFLGKGNMGQVYKARHQRLKRLVALKVIHPQFLDNANAVARFHREAEAAARLNHPNIVQIYDAADVDGVHFLAMEYVEGNDLGKRVGESGPLPPYLACEWMRQAAVALQHAHEQGLVHRDIKPSNLMVTQPALGQLVGTVKVLDLGLARVGRTDSGEQSSLTLTQTGAAMGTPAYLAPEQAMDAHQADIRSDIYSLGCTLYHLLAGRLPFQANDLAQMVAFHLMKEAEPLHGLRNDVPPQLDAVVRRMMAKKPADRFQTPAEVADALAAFARTDDDPSVGPRSTARLVRHTPPTQSLVATRGDHSNQTVPEAKAAPRRRFGALRAFLVLGVLLAGAVGLLAVLAPDEFHKGVESVRAMLPTAFTPGTSPTTTGSTPATTARTTTPATAQANSDFWFTPLFNGRDLAGWSVDSGPADAWTVSAGAIVGRGGGSTARGWLLTDRVYTDYVLRGQFQLAADADSAIGIRCERLETIGGLPMHLAVKLRRQRAGTVETGSVYYWLNLAEAPHRTADLKPPGEWNDLELELSGPRLRVSVNGVEIQALNLAVVLGNKPNVMSGVNRRSGRIGLQQHTGEVRFRNLRIKELAAGAQAQPPAAAPASWAAYSRAVTSLALTPDGQYVVTGSEERDVRVWKLATGQKDVTMQGHLDWVRAVVVTPDGEKVISAGDDKTIRVWERRTGRELHVFQGHTGPVLTLTVSPSGTELLSGGGDRSVRQWSIPQAKQLASFQSYSGLVWSVGFDGTGRNMAVSAGFNVSYETTATGREWWSRRNLNSSVTTLALSADGKLVAGASVAGVTLWDLATGKEMATLRASGTVAAVAFSPDSQHVVAGGSDKLVHVWNIKTGQEVAVLPGHADSVTCVAVTPTGQAVVSGGRDGTVRVWPFRTKS